MNDANITVQDGIFIEKYFRCLTKILSFYKPVPLIYKT